MRDRPRQGLMGQALFVVVFAALVAVAVAWGADDLRVRGQLSELAELVLRLLSVVGAGVFLLATTAGAWSAGVPLLVRVPLGVGLALVGLALVLTAGRRVLPGAGRVLPSPVQEGFLVMAVAAAIVVDSLASLVIVALACIAARVLTAAAVAGADTARQAPDPSSRWTSRAA